MVKYGAGDLLKAVEVIESIPDAEFNLHYWWLPDGMAFDDDRNKMYRAADSQCGCAIGHMAHRGVFGLTDEVLRQDRSTVFCRIADLFAISREVAEFLFSSYAYRNTQGAKAKEDVINRLQFCAAQKSAGRI